MYDPLNVYRGRYKEFIESIINERPLNEEFHPSEKHHVIPSCCNGVDNTVDNYILYLTCSEHFIAHKILAQENPDNIKLSCAYWRMCNGKHEISKEDYEEARVNYIQNIAPKIGNKNLTKLWKDKDFRSKAVTRCSVNGKLSGKHNIIRYNNTEDGKKLHSEIITNYNTSERGRLNSSKVGKVHGLQNIINYNNSEKGKLQVKSLGLSNKGTKLVNNGIVSKRINADDLDYYLSIGFSLGMLPRRKDV